LSSDSKLQNIKPFQGSPVTWFRNPYARLILVRTWTDMTGHTCDAIITFMSA